MCALRPVALKVVGRAGGGGGCLEEGPIRVTVRTSEQEGRSEIRSALSLSRVGAPCPSPDGRQCHAPPEARDTGVLVLTSQRMGTPPYQRLRPDPLVCPQLALSLTPQVLQLHH